MQNLKLTYTWGVGLLTTLNTMRIDDEMCDLRLILQNNEIIKAHSCVLAAASPFLKSLLIDTFNPEISMHDFPVEIMRQIIEFIYTGEASVKKPDLLMMHSVAVSLNIPVLADLAQKMIHCAMTPGKSINLQEDKWEMISGKTRDGDSGKTRDGDSGNTHDGDSGKTRDGDSLSEQQQQRQTPGDTQKAVKQEDVEVTMKKRKRGRPSKYSPSDHDQPETPKTSKKAQKSHTPKKQPKRSSENLSPVVCLERLSSPGLALSGFLDTILGDVSIKEEIDEEDPLADNTQAHDGQADESFPDDGFDDNPHAGDETVGGAGGEMSSEPVALNTASGQQEVNPLVTEHPVTIATSPGSILQQEVIGSLGDPVQTTADVVGPSLLEITAHYTADPLQLEFDQAETSAIEQVTTPVSSKKTRKKSKPKPPPGPPKKRKLYGTGLLQAPVHDGPTYTCGLCGRAFSDLAPYERHCVIHNRKTSEGKRFPCDYCAYSSEYKAVLDEHLRTHTGEMPYTCNHCGKSFKHRKSWQAHENMHLGRKYKCRTCEKEFSTPQYRGRHEKIVHLGLRDYKCPICNRCFSTSGCLKSHLETHNDEANYQCFICDKLFFTKASQKAHMFKKHTERPHYSCNKCGKSFLHVRSIRNHKCQITFVEKERRYKRNLQTDAADTHEHTTRRLEVSVVSDNQVEPQYSHQGEPQMSQQGEPQSSPQGEPQMSQQGEPQTSQKGELQTSQQGEPQMSQQGEPQMSQQGEPQMSQQGEPRAYTAGKASQVMVISSSTVEEEIDDTDGETSSDEDDYLGQDVLDMEEDLLDMEEDIM